MSEMDGVRVIGQETSDLIQKVPGRWLNVPFYVAIFNLAFG